MEIEKLLQQILENQVKMQADITNIRTELQDVKASQVRMEQDHGTKITALFDGHTLRGDQIERLQNHLDERLDAIHTDLSYVVSKTAQHERQFIRLNKETPGTFLRQK